MLSIFKGYFPQILMPIVRLDITGVNCKKEETGSNKPVKVMTSAEPVDAKIKKINNQDVMLIDFDLKTKYEPKIGELKVSGTAFYVDNKLKDKYVKDKKGKIKIKPDVVREVAQAVFTAPAIVLVNMAKELRLPLPIQFPRVEMKTQA
jgi:hypothetical protein